MFASHWLCSVAFCADYGVFIEAERLESGKVGTRYAALVQEIAASCMGDIRYVLCTVGSETVAIERWWHALGVVHSTKVVCVLGSFMLMLSDFVCLSQTRGAAAAVGCRRTAQQQRCRFLRLGGPCK
jgi:hypothetical protein